MTNRHVVVAVDHRIRRQASILESASPVPTDIFLLFSDFPRLEKPRRRPAELSSNGHGSQMPDGAGVGRRVCMAPPPCGLTLTGTLSCLFFHMRDGLCDGEIINHKICISPQ